jgi:hypothetical protein
MAKIKKINILSADTDVEQLQLSPLLGEGV